MDLGFAFKIMRARAPGAYPQTTSSLPQAATTSVSGMMESSIMSADGGGKHLQRQPSGSPSRARGGSLPTATAPPPSPPHQQQQQQQQQPMPSAERTSPQRQQQQQPPAGPRRSLSAAALTLAAAASEQPSPKGPEPWAGYGLAAVLAQEGPNSIGGLHLVPRPLVPSARGVTIGPFAEAIAAATVRPARRRIDVSSLPLPLPLADRGRSTLPGCASPPTSPLTASPKNRPAHPAPQQPAAPLPPPPPQASVGASGTPKASLRRTGAATASATAPATAPAPRGVLLPQVSPHKRKQPLLLKSSHQHFQQQQYGDALLSGTGARSSAGTIASPRRRPSNSSPTAAATTTVGADTVAGQSAGSLTGIGYCSEPAAPPMPPPLPLPLPPPLAPPRCSPRAAAGTAPGPVPGAGPLFALASAHTADLAPGPAPAAGPSSRPASAGERAVGWRLPAAGGGPEAALAAADGEGPGGAANGGGGSHHGDPAQAPIGGSEVAHAPLGVSRSMSGAAAPGDHAGREGPSSLPSLPMLGRPQHTSAALPFVTAVTASHVAAGPGPGSGSGLRGASQPQPHPPPPPSPPAAGRPLSRWGSEKSLLLPEASTQSGGFGYGFGLDGDVAESSGPGGEPDVDEDAEELDLLERWAAAAQLGPAVLEATAEQRRALRRLSQLRNRLLHARGFSSVCTSPEPGSGGLHAVPSWADLVVTSRRGSESLVAMANQVSRLPHIDYDQMRDPQYRMLLKLRSRQAKVHHPILNDDFEDTPIRGRRRPWKPLHI